MKHVILSMICVIMGGIVSACVGPKVEAYETKSQRFKWGKAYVWMSPVAGSKRGATEGRGFLLMDTFYKKRYLNKKCEITISKVTLRDSRTGELLIEEIPTYSDGLPMKRTIGDYRSGQFHMSYVTFEFEREAFPYDVKMYLNFDCEGKITEQVFSKQIKFKMVQPVIWEQ